MNAEVKVLIVEDDALIAMDLEDELTDRGFAVRSAPTISKAQQLLEGFQPSLAVLDMHLRSEDTFALATELQQSGVPFFFLSGNDASALPEHLRGSRIFTKPVRLEQIVEAINSTARP